MSSEDFNSLWAYRACRLLFRIAEVVEKKYFRQAGSQGTLAYSWHF
ncbi:hypothetical protein [Chitinophaga sp. HK235]|nr:hypothetical protein [Chitinophaga sp. HK235]